MKRCGFTMIELVVVIVVLGILSSIAISKMAVTRDDAQLVKGRSEVSAIRSAITLQRSMNMMSGAGGNPTRLDALGFTAGVGVEKTTSSDGDKLFDYDTDSSSSRKKILDYPIMSKDANGGWRKTAADKYTFKVVNTDIEFTYSAGNFDCDHAASDAKVKKYCKALTE